MIKAKFHELARTITLVGNRPSDAPRDLAPDQAGVYMTYQEMSSLLTRWLREDTTSDRWYTL